MKHALPDLQGDIYTGIFGLFGKPGRVIEQEFVSADINEHRRQPVQVTIKRGYPRQTRIIISRVIFTENSLCFLPAYRINLSLCLK